MHRFLLPVVWLALSVLVGAQTPVQRQPVALAKGVTIAAATSKAEGLRITASDVTVTTQDAVITADEAIFDRVTGGMELRGNVRVTARSGFYFRAR